MKKRTEKGAKPVDEIAKLKGHVSSLRRVCEAAFHLIEALKYAEYEQVKFLVQEVEEAMQAVMKETTP